MSTRNIVVACLFVVIASSCEEFPTSAVPKYDGPQPVLPQTAFNYTGEEWRNKVATLGRVLFYDKQLSYDNTVACASCHKQSAAFADNVAFSNGFNNKATLRNSMPIQNLSMLSFLVVPTDSSSADYGSASPGNLIGGLFWDGRESDLTRMVTQPITNHDEMGNINVYDAGTRIARLPYYSKLFKDAFLEDINVTNAESQISIALMEYVMSIKTTNTRFDAYLQFGGTLSDQEAQGLALFQTKYNCNGCHRVEETVQTSSQFANIGLDFQYKDNGLSTLTNTSADDGKFRVPSLRNVELTGPYMHDGRFNTLEQVIDHYSNGIFSHPNLHRDLQNESGGAQQMNISPDESKALIAFLKTLTDRSVLTDPKFSDPFK